MFFIFDHLAIWANCVGLGWSWEACRVFTVGHLNRGFVLRKIFYWLYVYCPYKLTMRSTLTHTLTTFQYWRERFGIILIFPPGETLLTSFAKSSIFLHWPLIGKGACESTIMTRAYFSDTIPKTMLHSSLCNFVSRSYDLLPPRQDMNLSV